MFSRTRAWRDLMTDAAVLRSSVIIYMRLRDRRRNVKWARPDGICGRDRVIAEGPNPQKKDLLRRMVKKVLVHSRRTIEIWYALPNRRGFEDSNIRLPLVDTTRTLIVGISEQEVIYIKRLEKLVA
jgi:hypothetical protein